MPRLDADPQDAHAWFVLGTYFAATDREKARDCFLRALVLEPEHEDAQSALNALDQPESISAVPTPSTDEPQTEELPADEFLPDDLEPDQPDEPFSPEMEREMESEGVSESERDRDTAVEEPSPEAEPLLIPRPLPIGETTQIELDVDPEERAAAKKMLGRALPAHQQVIITDIRMPFWSMVVFIIKWTLASIPALIILFLLFFGLILLFGSVLTTFLTTLS